MEGITYGHDAWHNLSLSGKTVGAVISEYATVFNLPTDATVMVNGESVDRAYVIEEGDTIEIVRATGQKG